MSVLFATILPDAVILCADKLATNSKTGEQQKKLVSKINQWSSSIAIGGTGTMELCEIIKSTVYGYIGKDNISDFTLEEIADCFCQCYYAVGELYSDMPKEAFAEFVVAGKMSNGRVGVIHICVGNNEAETDVVVSNNTPTTLILAPADMTDFECNLLFQKAIRSASNENLIQDVGLEIAHRRAVQYVSEKSRFVGSKSDYIIIKSID